jgi:hypothetical protein
MGLGADGGVGGVGARMNPYSGDATMTKKLRIEVEEIYKAVV